MNNTDNSQELAILTRLTDRIAPADQWSKTLSFNGLAAEAYIGSFTPTAAFNNWFTMLQVGTVNVYFSACSPNVYPTFLTPDLTFSALTPVNPIALPRILLFPKTISLFVATGSDPATGDISIERF